MALYNTITIHMVCKLFFFIHAIDESMRVHAQYERCNYIPNETDPIKVITHIIVILVYLFSLSVSSSAFLIKKLNRQLTNTTKNRRWIERLRNYIQWKTIRRIVVEDHSIQLDAMLLRVRAKNQIYKYDQYAQRYWDIYRNILHINLYLNALNIAIFFFISVFCGARYFLFLFSPYI